VLAAHIIIALMMAAESTSEMSLNFYQTTRHNIPEDIFRINCCRGEIRREQVLNTSLERYHYPISLGFNFEILDIGPTF
jgi:hypothetical protein